MCELILIRPSKVYEEQVMSYSKLLKSGIIDAVLNE